MTANISFGAKLRQTRERRGLTQEEAAKALCLNIEIISALENEQFDKLPSAVFVRGYIKNYASLLKLVINEPPAAAPQSVQENADTETVMKTDNIKWLASLNKIFFKLINYIVIISLLILVFIWWYERQGAIEKTENSHSVINMSMEKIPFERAQPTKALKPLLPTPKNNKKLELSKDIMKSVFPGWPL